MDTMSYQFDVSERRQRKSLQILHIILGQWLSGFSQSRIHIYCIFTEIPFNFPCCISFVSLLLRHHFIQQVIVEDNPGLEQIGCKPFNDLLVTIMTASNSPSDLVDPACQTRSRVKKMGFFILLCFTYILAAVSLTHLMLSSAPEYFDAGPVNYRNLQANTVRKVYDCNRLHHKFSTVSYVMNSCRDACFPLAM
jgi:hypothetical protein